MQRRCSAQHIFDTSCSIDPDGPKEKRKTLKVHKLNEELDKLAEAAGNATKQAGILRGLMHVRASPSARMCPCMLRGVHARLSAARCPTGHDPGADELDCANHPEAPQSACVEWGRASLSAIRQLGRVCHLACCRSMPPRKPYLMRGTRMRRKRMTTTA